MLEGLKDLTAIRPFPMTVEADGRRYEGPFLFGSVSNTTSIGGMVKLPPALVEMGDGRLEVLLIRPPQNAGELTRILQCLQKQAYDGELVNLFQTASLDVQCPEPFSWSLGRRTGGGWEAAPYTLSPPRRHADKVENAGRSLSWMNGFVPLTGKNVTPSPWHGDFKKTPAGEPADAEGAFISFYSPISPSPVCAAFHSPLYPPAFPAERGFAGISRRRKTGGSPRRIYPGTLKPDSSHAPFSPAGARCCGAARHSPRLR